MNFNGYLEFIGLKGGPNHHAQSQSHSWGSKRDLQQKLNKMRVPMYDGRKVTARAWLHQLQTYSTMGPNMVEEDAIHFVSLYFEGDALEWWRHGLTSQNYSNITSFDEFARRLVKRFDRKKEDDCFRDLTSLRQSEAVDEYVAEFQRIAVMIHNISEGRLTFMFLEGLMEPL